MQPGIFKHLLSCQTLSRVWFKHTAHQAFGTIRYLRPKFPLKIDHASQDRQSNTLLSLCPKQRNPGLNNTASPKSMALRTEFSLLSAKGKFLGFRSLCVTPLAWHILTTSAMVLATFAAVLHSSPSPFACPEDSHLFWIPFFFCVNQHHWLAHPRHM